MKYVIGIESDGLSEYLFLFAFDFILLIFFCLFVGTNANKFEIIEKQVDVIASNSLSSLSINLSPNHKIFDKFGKAFSLRDGE